MAGHRKKIEFYVDKNGCHICTSHAINTHGYPGLWYDGKPNNMHRVLYIEKFGHVKKGIVIRHKCDNRKCINLNHTEPGTHADNMLDCKKRGRMNTPRGEIRKDCKLKDSQVREIRKSSDTQYNISKKYKINQSTVSRIKSGEKRKYVT